MSNDFKESMYVDINAIRGESFSNTKEALKALKAIKPMDYDKYHYGKDFISETQFYQQIMKVIQHTQGVEFSNEDTIQFGEALKKLGCIDFATWKERTQTVYPKGTPLVTLINEGDNGAAVKTLEELCLGSPQLFEKTRKSMLAIGNFGIREEIEPGKGIGVKAKQTPIGKWINASEEKLKDLVKSDDEVSKDSDER